MKKFEEISATDRNSKDCSGEENSPAGMAPCTIDETQRVAMVDASSSHARLVAVGIDEQNSASGLVARSFVLLSCCLDSASLVEQRRLSTDKVRRYRTSEQGLMDIQNLAPFLPHKLLTTLPMLSVLIFLSPSNGRHESVRPFTALCKNYTK